jgi:hypothetical protein
MEIKTILQAIAAIKAVVERSAMVEPEKVKEAAWSLAQMLDVQPGTILGFNTYLGERLGYFQVSKVKDIELSWNPGATSMRVLVDTITRSKHGRPLKFRADHYIELLTQEQKIEVLTEEDWIIAQKNLENENTPSEP